MEICPGSTIEDHVILATRNTVDPGKFHFVAFSVAVEFGGRFWNGTIERLLEAFPDHHADVESLKQGRLRLPYQIKSDAQGQHPPPQAGIHFLLGLFSNGELVNRLFAKDQDERTIISRLMLMGSLLYMGGVKYVLKEENRAPLRQISSPPPQQQSRKRKQYEARLVGSPGPNDKGEEDLVNASTSIDIQVEHELNNMVEEQEEEGNPFMTDFLKNLDAYAKKVAPYHTIEARIDFPYGRRCPLPVWNNSIFPTILSDISNYVKENCRWDNDNQSIKDAVASVVNKHLLCDRSNTSVLYRTSCPSEVGFVDLQECKWYAFKEAHKNWTIPLKVTVRHARQTKEKIVNKAIVEIWWENARKTCISGRVFVPFPPSHPDYAKYLPKDFLNLYTGLRFSLEEANRYWKGTDAAAFEARVALARYLLHECFVWCRGYKDRILFTLLYKAKKLLQPYWKPNSSIINYGREGAGKTTHVDIFGRLFGRHYLRFVHLEKNLTGFNRADMETSVFALADELSPMKDEQTMSILRMLITDHETTLHLKYQNERTIFNYKGIIMLSNSPHMISASSSSRRWCVLECLPIKAASDPLLQTYMQSYLQITNLPFDSDAGYKVLHGFYLDSTIFTPQMINDFGDGSKLPGSAESLLGSQRAMGANGVTVFWGFVLERGYIVPPEGNPLHPVNATDELSQQVTSISSVGYQFDVDFTQPHWPDTMPIHKIGRSWACVLLQNSIYEEYRDFISHNKAYGTGFAPENMEKFWALTYLILPSLQEERNNNKINLVVPSVCFTSAEIRSKWIPGVSGDDHESVESRAKAKRVRRQTISHKAIKLPTLSNLRNEYKLGAGRPDLEWSDMTEGLDFARRDPRTKQAYPKWTAREFLQQFGFTEQEMDAIFPGQDLDQVYRRISNLPDQPHQQQQRTEEQQPPPHTAPISIQEFLHDHPLPPPTPGMHEQVDEMDISGVRDDDTPSPASYDGFFSTDYDQDVLLDSEEEEEIPRIIPNSM